VVAFRVQPEQVEEDEVPDEVVVQVKEQDGQEDGYFSEILPLLFYEV
jgi:hypothetical protein